MGWTGCILRRGMYNTDWGGITYAMATIIS